MYVPGTSFDMDASRPLTTSSASSSPRGMFAGSRPSTGDGSGGRAPPWQLEEALALPSPTSTPPQRGLRMREYEDKLSRLQKENWQLKVDNYCMGERLQRAGGGGLERGQLGLDREDLLAEIDKKQSLLVSAAEALELMERQHEERTQELRERIRDLEEERAAQVQRAAMGEPHHRLLQPGPGQGDDPGDGEQQAEALRRRVEELEETVRGLRQELLAAELAAAEQRLRADRAEERLSSGKRAALVSLHLAEPDGRLVVTAVVDQQSLARARRQRRRRRRPRRS